MNITHRKDIDVKNLCSRKLWELLTDDDTIGAALADIEAELESRRHYLSELTRLKTQRGRVQQQQHRYQ